MSALGEGMDDLFDFSEQVLGEPAKDTQSDKLKPVLTNESEVLTSYLLVNALMNLLIRKHIIQSHEVQVLIAELHVEYMKLKRGKAE
jgi:hypothetical protein